MAKVLSARGGHRRRHGGKIVGWTLSGGSDHRVDKPIALAMLCADLAQAATPVEVCHQRFGATMQPGQTVRDPKNEQARA